MNSSGPRNWRAGLARDSRRQQRRGGSGEEEEISTGLGEREALLAARRERGARFREGPSRDGSALPALEAKLCQF